MHICAFAVFDERSWNGTYASSWIWWGKREKRHVNGKRGEPDKMIGKIGGPLRGASSL